MMGWNCMVLTYFRWMRAVRRTCQANAKANGHGDKRNHRGQSRTDTDNSQQKQIANTEYNSCA